MVKTSWGGLGGQYDVSIFEKLALFVNNIFFSDLYRFVVFFVFMVFKRFYMFLGALIWRWSPWKLSCFET